MLEARGASRWLQALGRIARATGRVTSSGMRSLWGRGLIAKYPSGTSVGLFQPGQPGVDEVDFVDGVDAVD